MTVEIKPVFDAAGAAGFLHAREVGVRGGPEVCLGADDPVVLDQVLADVGLEHTRVIGCCEDLPA